MWISHCKKMHNKHTGPGYLCVNTGLLVLKYMPLQWRIIENKTSRILSGTYFMLKFLGNYRKYELIFRDGSCLGVWAKGEGRGTLESSIIHRYTLLFKSIQTRSSDMCNYLYVRWTSIKTLVLKMPWTEVYDFLHRKRVESCGVGKSFRHAISDVSQWVTTHCAASLLSWTSPTVTHVKGQGARMKGQLWLYNASWEKNWYNFLSIT